MEKENPILADRFAHIVDPAYDDGKDDNFSDEDFREEMANALNEWLGRE